MEEELGWARATRARRWPALLAAVALAALVYACTMVRAPMRSELEGFSTDPHAPGFKGFSRAGPARSAELDLIAWEEAEEVLKESEAKQAVDKINAPPSDWSGKFLPPVDEMGRQRVCILMQKNNPRHASIFVNQYLFSFGGRLRFHLSPALREALNPYYENESIRHEELDHPEAVCDPAWPKVNLAQHEVMHFTKFPDTWMVVGDEFCLCKKSLCGTKTRKGSGQVAQLRNYYDRDYISPYVPLGPQFWFLPINDYLPASQRGYVFNFAGSITSGSRRNMAKYIQNPAVKKAFPVLNRGFVHVRGSWTSDLRNTNYVFPEIYRTMLLNSTFTLCPSGKNVESFRVFEAVEAGSIPVIALDRAYNRSRCTDSFRPLLDSAAPFVVLSDWKELPAKLSQLISKPDLLDQMQRDMHEWKVRYWTGVRKLVECSIIRRHNEMSALNQLSLPSECSVVGEPTS